MAYYILNNKQREKERLLKTVKEIHQITYKVKPIKITLDFSTETFKTRNALNEVISSIERKQFQA
jgi:hypothetical protein